MTRALAVGLALVLATPASAETLHDAIAAAYATNPTLAAAAARQQALGETIEQARAGGRLTASVDAIGGYDRYDFGKGGGATANATLPIWTGGRVSSAVRAAQEDTAAGAEGVRDTVAAILENVVAAYADLLYDQQAVDIATADIALLDNQVADSEARFRLGNATRTDVARLQAQRAGARATLAANQATLATDAATFRAIVGRDPEPLAPPPEALVALPGTLDQAHQRALAANALLGQSRRTADADAARIDQARANGAPSLTLGGSYGYDADLGRSADRTFPRAASAGVALHVPILTGGLVRSQVRQAQASYRAAQFDTEASARDALRTADSAWAAVVGARAGEAANVESVAAAELALKGVRAEYAFGLRSTLDILVADESLRGAQLALARSRSDLLIAQAALLHATGRLDPDAYPAQAEIAAASTH